MCGRFALSSDTREIRQRFGLRDAPDVKSRFNVAPGSVMPVVTTDDPRTAVLARWGLIPSWARDPKIGYRMINARAETLGEKPAFRGPFRNKRCLIPASGFYEWKQLDGEKVPFYIHHAGEPVFAFAGLYDVWKDAEDRPLMTFTIITTRPNDLMKPIHDRMPVILARNYERKWLDSGVSDPEMLRPMLVPYAGGGLEAYPVSKAVNNPENDSPGLTAARP
ncbi:hypothetical protein A2Z33_06595 [Candidatus Gottesmanbacteria bacterium RBG_16_52_11]|uniref:Abasic site processing protein n=1 Tax=Candidatus Gottesmanbacteria bacterium RBG_16_52_11 TaxID=1798374 RepID=A0A1F5YXS9_9BACT|nr:MAG: hypothetical protein A2Z33_06595 [Candidatus Gottesmanbacteria bacterium RBG_16_52_11]